MSQVLGVRHFRKRQFRTLSLLCDEEPLSDAQLKAYQTKLQEYQNFLDSVVRLALCGNVCVTEEVVTIGEHGLLTGEALNALQHAGAISVYNTLQQNNWEFPVPEEGEVAVIKSHTPVPDEFLDSEKPVRSDWPAVHISECFIEGEKAKLHGSVRPLRTFLPPTVVFRNAADIDDDLPDTDLNAPAVSGLDAPVELVPTVQGIAVKRINKSGKDTEYIPVEEYFFGREEGNADYVEEKGDFRFKCAVCQRIFYSNIKLMSHILGHVDETSQAGLIVADPTRCAICDLDFPSVFDLQTHLDRDHTGASIDTQNFARLDAGEDHANRASSNIPSQHQITPYSQTDLAVVGQSSAPLSCRICGKEASSEYDLAHHLHSTHRQREMPYVCRLCLFRSSLFEDILEHFKKVHGNSNHLLCTYCLRIFTPSDARPPLPAAVSSSGTLMSPPPGSGIGQTQVYLQHLRMHQVQHQLRRCPSCKLNFTNKSDYQVHRRLDHKGTRPDTALRSTESRGDAFEHSGVLFDEAMDQDISMSDDTHPRIQSMNAPDSCRTKILNSINLPDNIASMNCLECDQDLGTSNHRRYLSCSMCRFGTFCAIGYSRHLSQGHVYVSGTQPTEPDVGTPLVRPVYFDWIAEEVRSASSHNETTAVRDSQLACPTSQATVTVPVCQEQPAQTTFAVKELNAETTQPPEHIEPEVLSGSDPQNKCTTQDTTETDITDLLLYNPDATPQPSSEIVNPEKPGRPEVECPIPDMDVDKTLSSEQVDPWTMVSSYMSTRLDARLFACIHCAATNLNGNSLARHLFEECGTSTATLNPNPALVKARGEVLAQASRQHREQQSAEAFETDILFESSEPGGTSHPSQALVGDPQTDGDVLMTQAPTQFSSYGLIEGQAEQAAFMAGNHMITQVNAAGGTTIEITDPTGQVVQQFLIPDDIQLEEGQTFVLIHDENGQPQLAIVNQADLMDSNNPSVLVQSEEDGEQGVLLYTSSEEQMQDSTGIVSGRDDEKENRQFAL